MSRQFFIAFLVSFIGLAHVAHAATLARTFRLDFPDVQTIDFSTTQENAPVNLSLTAEGAVPAFSEFAPFASAFGAQVKEIEVSFTTYFFLAVFVAGDPGIPVDGGAVVTATSTVKVDGEQFFDLAALAVECSGFPTCTDFDFNGRPGIERTVKVRDQDDLDRYVAGDVALFTTLDASLVLADGEAAIGFVFARTFGEIRFDYMLPTRSVAIAAVPLPASGWLLMFAALAMMRWRR